MTYLFLAALFQGVWSLRDLRVSVPEAVKVGSPAILNCFFDMEGEALYSLRWYRNQEEFFRYTPKETPSAKKFAVAGIPENYIEISESNATQVKLSRTSRETSGLFCCEVSAEFPSFFTLEVSSPMIVVEPPVGKPSITGLKLQYRLGETLTANCTAPGSRPAANITWFVNNHLVEQHRYNVTEWRRTLTGDSDQTSSQLKINLTRRHLFHHSGQYRSMRIKCAASVFNVYTEWVEKFVDLDKKSRSAQAKGKEENDAVEPRSKNPNSSKDGDYWGRGRHQDSNRLIPFKPTEGSSDESKAGFLEKVSTGRSSITESHHISVILVLACLVHLKLIAYQR
ncbi:Hypothetical protein NTJ_07836 [Nesidiocoris tenuis]|uniref:Ig-like domain-containing protein n=1 Tax=Nesidiocoris tenuis TaxID=355587 RepID=A0ABN7AUG9_9HEMI|nr:Hypothetical protein NTJ_07836 [Nesidiocoris tenuis]